MPKKNVYLAENKMILQDKKKKKKEKKAQTVKNPPTKQETWVLP